MPTIFGPSSIVAGEIPTVSDLSELNSFIERRLQRSYEEGDILAATSYGSVPAGTADRASDVDWLIVMRDAQRMFTSPVLKEIVIAHDERHVDWNSPVTSMDTIRHGLHHLGLLAYGIERSVRRNIVGEDPMSLLRDARQDTRETLRRILSSFSRYAIERLAISRAETESEISGLLQTSVNTFQETYRSLIAIHAIESNAEMQLDFQTYQSLADAVLPDDARLAGERIFSFISSYREQLEGIGSISGSSESERQQDIQCFSNFLRRNASLAADAAQFVQENCRLVSQGVL